LPCVKCLDCASFAQKWKMRHSALLALRRYAIPAAAVLAVALVSLLLLPLHVNPAPLFVVAVLVSAWYGGLGPSLLAVVLSVLAIDYFFYPPYYALEFNMSDVAWAGVFVLGSALLTWFAQSRKRAEAALRQQAAQLQEQARALDLAHVVIRRGQRPRGRSATRCSRRSSPNR